MPTYDFHCQACGETQEVKMTYQEFDTYKTGGEVRCRCGKRANHVIATPGDGAYQGLEYNSNWPSRKRGIRKRRARAR